MAKLRRTYHSKHRRAKSSSVRIFVALIILIGVMYLIVRVDLTSTTFLNWMTETRVNDTMDRVTRVLVYDHAVVGYSNGEQLPVWVSFNASDAGNDVRRVVLSPDTAVLINADRVQAPLLPLYMPRSPAAIDSLPHSLGIPVSDSVMPMIREFYQQLGTWERNIGEIRVVAGPFGDMDERGFSAMYAALYSIDGENGHGFILRKEDYDKSLLQLAISIDSVESLTGLDFFSDLLDVSMQERVEAKPNALSWGYDLSLFEERKRTYSDE